MTSGDAIALAIGLALAPIVIGFFVCTFIARWHEARLCERLFTHHREVWIKLAGPTVIGCFGWSPKEKVPISDRDLWTGYRFDWHRKAEPEWLALTPEVIENYRQVKKWDQRSLYFFLPVGAAFFGLLIWLWVQRS